VAIASKASLPSGTLEAMAKSEQAVPERRHYGDHRPYPDPPSRLADLIGPTEGVIELPITIDWGPKRRYDMGRDSDRRIAYERVLREAATTGRSTERACPAPFTWHGFLAIIWSVTAVVRIARSIR
jgi:hypothetical protein